MTNLRQLENDRPALDRVAVELSHRWVQRVHDQLLAQGRSFEGGWPGTNTEARQISTAWVSNEVSGREPSRLTGDLLDRLARAVYDSAKKQWLSLAGARSPLKR